MKRHHTALLGSILRVASLVATTLVAFFLMPFLVHRLGDRLYGYWALVGAVLGYYGLLDLGIVTAVQFQVAKALGNRDPEVANRTISTAFYIFALIGMFIFVLTLIVAWFAPAFISSPQDIRLFRTVLALMGVGFAVGFPGRTFVGAISAHLRLDLTAGVSVLVLIVKTILIVLVIGRGGGIVSLALIALVGDAILYTLYYLILRKIQANLKISLAFANRQTLKDLFNYSRYALIVQISDQLRFFIDGWTVGIFVGVSAVTHYAVAGRLTQAFLAMMIALLGILSPWFSQLWGSSDFAGVQRIFMLGTKASASISTIIACGLILYGHAFVKLWMGPAYLDAYWPLLILVSAIFVDVSQQPSVAYLYGVSRHRFLAWLTLAEAIVNVGLSIYLAHPYGMIGVALGTLIPMTIAKLFIQPIYVCRHLPLPLRTYYGNLLGRSIVPAALSSIILWVLLFSKIDFTNLLVLCVAISFQALVTAAVAFYFAFDKEEKSMLADKILPLFRIQWRPRAVEVPR